MYSTINVILTLGCSFIIILIKALKTWRNLFVPIQFSFIIYSIILRIFCFYLLLFSKIILLKTDRPLENSSQTIGDTPIKVINQPLNRHSVHILNRLRNVGNMFPWRVGDKLIVCDVVYLWEDRRILIFIDIFIFWCTTTI